MIFFGPHFNLMKCQNNGRSSCILCIWYKCWPSVKQWVERAGCYRAQANFLKIEEDPCFPKLVHWVNRLKQSHNSAGAYENVFLP